MLLAKQTGFFKMECFKEVMNDEVYFWHPEKHQNFLDKNLIKKVLHV